MLLILTNSLDGTSDALSGLAEDRGLGLFRLNTDLLGHYRIHITDGDFSIEDPVGRRITRGDVSSCLWRKPWHGGHDLLKNYPQEERDWMDAQVKVMIREIVNICRLDGKLRLVESDAARRADKITQMEIAKRYFRVPMWDYVFNVKVRDGKRITKALSANLLTKNGEFHSLYTTVVDAGTLSPSYPWLIQDLALGNRDTTLVYIAGKMALFGVVRRRDDSVVDWRVNINSSHEDEWEQIELSPELSRTTESFMTDMGLRYGRLDFVLDEATGESWFLEVNANGQFGWLDDSKLTLHQWFLDAALDPANTITSPPCGRLPYSPA